MLVSRSTSYANVLRLFGIPYLEQAVECPFDTVDPDLLVLQSVLSSEGLGIDLRPVIAPVEIEEVNVGQQ